MSGFDNEVMYAPGERLQASSAQDIARMQLTGTDVSRVNHIGDPNDVVTGVAANPSSLSHDPSSGFLWLKVSGTGIPTWQRLFPSPTPPILSVLTAHATPQFVLSGTTETVDFGLTNLLLGDSGVSITSAVGNVGLGLQALTALTSGFTNTAVGFQSAFQITSGHANTALGYQALVTAAATTNGNIAIGQSAGAALLGDNNTVVGTNALSNGGVNNNIAIGSTAANTYVGPESNNIMIGNVGVVGESNVMRIGTTGSGTGQQNETFVAAITGVTVASSSPVAVNSLGQLSDLGFGTATTVLTSNGAGASPTWQPITTGGFTWNVVTSATNVNTVVKENGYIPKGGSQVIFILPAAADVGDLFIIAGYGNLWTLTQNANQSVTLGDTTTTVGVGGSLTATQVRDTITVVCVTTNTEFQVLNSVGNLTLV